MDYADAFWTFRNYVIGRACGAFNAYFANVYAGDNVVGLYCGFDAVVKMRRASYHTRTYYEITIENVDDEWEVDALNNIIGRSAKYLGIELPIRAEPTSYRTLIHVGDKVYLNIGVIPHMEKVYRAETPELEVTVYVCGSRVIRAGEELKSLLSEYSNLLNELKHRIPSDLKPYKQIVDKLITLTWGREYVSIPDWLDESVVQHLIEDSSRVLRDIIIPKLKETVARKQLLS